jgi:Protein of unknown function (DUF2917)
MNMHATHPTQERFVSLHADQVRRLRGAARLRVALGMVWLTVTRQSEDHVLLPGDRFTLEPGSEALVQALGSRACLVVSESEPAWTQRASAALQTTALRFAGVLA